MTAEEESEDADGVVVDVMKEGSDSDAEEAAAKGVNSKEGREEVSLVELV